jgi:peptidoglycan hydrolase-like protein with peptidoglycan-binding domain
MKTLYKTMLLTTAAVCLAGGAALAEGTSANTDSHSYNASPSTTDGDQQTTIDAEPGNTNSANRSEDGMDRGAEANVDASTSMQTTAGLSNDQIQDAQQSLRQEGHSVSVDGVWGPQTAQAVRQFQQENGLDVTGSLDSETLAALEVDANANATTEINPTE